MDRKDAVIQMLDRDLEDAEEQYGMAVRGHGAIVQQLLDLQYQRMQVRSLPALVLCLLGPRWSHVCCCAAGACAHWLPPQSKIARHAHQPVALAAKTAQSFQRCMRCCGQDALHMGPDTSVFYSTHKTHCSTCMRNTITSHPLSNPCLNLLRDQNLVPRS